MKYDIGMTADTADTTALAVVGPQPVWMTLNRAREQAFTGEIVFETDPEVFAYFDNGIVYYAEPASDVSLGRRLFDAGVVDIAQLERGTVRVGGIEHLGRLFDRDPTVDRDAVLVLAETATQDLIAELAKHSVAAARFTAYRHHPSGVHRWFVAPSDPAALARPVSAGRQLDTTVVPELPGLPLTDDDIADLVIEWDDASGEMSELHADVFEWSLDLAGSTDAGAGADATPFEIEPIEAFEVFDLGEPASEGFEFSVVWPDGSEELATEATADLEEPISLSDEPADDAAVAEVDALDAALDALDAELEALDAETDEDNILRFAMAPLELSDEPESADAEVPDDVAEAVRRAIAAIESASAIEPAAAEPVPAVRAPDGTPGGLGSFAPPTMATRAEVLYAQMEAEAAMVEATPTLDDAVNERSSAVRRLIVGFRRKNH